MNIAIVPAMLWCSRLAWRVLLTRDYLPAMAAPDGHRWLVVAHWHRLQVGPLVVLWSAGSGGDR